MDLAGWFWLQSRNTLPPRTAYVYPGQGIQSKGMGLDERAKSPAVDDVWTRADRHTRDALGFSILSIALPAIKQRRERRK